MHTNDRYDPFNNRLCRNVRNALSESFRSALEKKDLQPVHDVAQIFLDEPLPAYVSDYIHRRLSAYEKVLETLMSKHLANPLDIAMVIWDRQLFFETHEYLEPHWMAATGKKKRLLLALIRAAGVYVHLEQGNIGAARRIAEKAIEGLLQDKDRLTAHADPQRLLDKLKTLDPVPPTLYGTGGPPQSSIDR